jgi:hypothetical protein
MSLQAMIQGFSKWRETTTTPPSGKQLGIYKALIQYYKHNMKKQAQATTYAPETNDDLAHTALTIQLHIINLAIRHTHTLARWTKVHNFFLEKQPGNPSIEKLRVIHIYEADWNIILKYFISFSLTSKACQENTVTPEQAGGRKGRSANDMATNTILTHEICRIQQLQGAVIYNDAKSCFERIIENISNIACIREGLAPEIASLHAQTLQHMKYYINTQYGCGHSHNSHMKPDPFLGLEQGAGDSMARWGFISDALIWAYNKQAISARITAPISHQTITTNIQAFVDDSHGIIIQEHSDISDINNIIQHNMQHWESLLNAIGGKLEISKCKVVKFRWESWKNGKQRLCLYNTAQPPIQIRDSESKQHVTLPEITTSQPYKLLGINMAFDGTSTAQTAILLPKLRYGLSATNMSNTSIMKSQQIVAQILLPKLGYNRHLPTAIVYAPKHFGGIGLIDMASEQGLAHIMFAVGHREHNPKSPSPSQHCSNHTWSLRERHKTLFKTQTNTLT